MESSIGIRTEGALVELSDSVQCGGRLGFEVVPTSC